MPRLIQSEVTAPLALADAEDWLADNPFEPEDETSLCAAASVLAGLAANRDFLGDLLLGQLKTRHTEEGDASAYGPQAIVLSPMRGNCFLRANIWPSEDEAAFQSSGASAFVYGVPHDHEAIDDPNAAIEAEYHQPPKPAEAKLGETITLTATNIGVRLDVTATKVEELGDQPGLADAGLADEKEGPTGPWRP